LLSFTFDGRNLEVVKEIFYLGLIFSVSGSFLSTKKALINKSNKAMYEVLKKGRLHNLSVKGQYDLFDKIVKPILLYGCEIWGFSNIELLERVQLKFCKLLLNLKKSTPNCMVYGELGVYPLSVSVKVRMVNFGSKLVNGKESKLSNTSTLYRYIYCQNMRNGFQSTCLNFVKNVLDNSGLNSIWLSQGNINSKWLSENLKRNLKINLFKNGDLTWKILQKVSVIDCSKRILNSKRI
jgi:hypothetical protein